VTNKRDRKPRGSEFRVSSVGAYHRTNTANYRSQAPGEKVEDEQVFKNMRRRDYQKYQSGLAQHGRLISPSKRKQ
jgi:hypothetical protein